jgi:hypothetical protein
MEITLKSDNLKDLAILIQLAKRMNIEVIESDSWEKQDLLSKASEASLKDVWLHPEDDIWDSFFLETKQPDKIR